jgi:hypothetical protein
MIFGEVLERFSFFFVQILPLKTGDFYQNIQFKTDFLNNGEFSTQFICMRCFLFIWLISSFVVWTFEN